VFGKTQLTYNQWILSKPTFVFNSCLWSHSLARFSWNSLRSEIGICHHRYISTLYESMRVEKSTQTHLGSLTSAEPDSYLLSRYENQSMASIYRIQQCFSHNYRRCLTHNGWGDLSFDGLVFHLLSKWHAFFYVFQQATLISNFTCLSFCLWRVQKETLPKKKKIGPDRIEGLTLENRTRARAV
jgi:hypothetical protein